MPNASGLAKKRKIAPVAKQESALAGFFAATVEQSKKRFGSEGVLVGTVEEENQYGIPWKHLAQMWLYKSNIFPLGNVIGLAGPSMSYKTAQGFDLCRLILDNGGASHIVEHENKLNRQFMHAIVGTGNINIVPAATVEDAQDSITEILDLYRKKANNSFPLLIGLDSLAGSNTKTASAAMKKEGHASKNYPEAANLWSNYFKWLSSELIGLNVNFYFTNHLKEKIDSVGFSKQYTKQGGSAQDFHAGQYIYAKNAGKIKSTTRPGEWLKLTVHKCGTGSKGHHVLVPVINEQWQDEITKEPQQKIYLDWDEAIAKLLVDDIQLGTTIKNKFDITVKSNRYSSKELNLKEVPGYKVGEAIRANPEFMEDFRQRLLIRKFPAKLAPPLSTTKKGDK